MSNGTVLFLQTIYFLEIYISSIAKRPKERRSVNNFLFSMTIEENKVYIQIYISLKRGRVRRYSDDPLGNGWNVEEVGMACRRVQRRSPVPKGPRRVRLAPVLTPPGTETQLNFKMICAILVLVVPCPRRSPSLPWFLLSRIDNRHSCPFLPTGRKINFIPWRDSPVPFR